MIHKMQKMHIRVKIGGGFAIVLLLTLLVGYVGHDGMRRVSDRVEKADDMNRMTKLILEARRHEKNFILRGDHEYVEKVQTHIRELKEQVAETRSKFRDPVNKQQADDILASVNAYETAFANYIAIAATGEGESTVSKKKKELDDEMVRAARALIKVCYEARADQKAKMDQQIRIAERLLIAGVLGAIVLGILSSVLISRRITGPIVRVVQGLTDASEQVSAVASQVSSASTGLADGASKQASSIEETSASLEEMSGMTRQNADNSGQAAHIMKTARDTVRKANESMAALTASMSEIIAASKETSDIVKTIDEIAFQTNLLALNASVEAARAGAAGAGFAVVATEVRNLAVRSARSAKNTSVLIEDTLKKIEEGERLVADTDTFFSEVSEGTVRSGELVDEIAAASTEQSLGIEQLNIAVNEIDRVIQQNAATAEEAASAAEEMNAQADEMREFVEELVRLVRGRTDTGGKQRI